MLGLSYVCNALRILRGRSYRVTCERSRRVSKLHFVAASGTILGRFGIPNATFATILVLSRQGKTAQNAVTVFTIELCTDLIQFWTPAASLWSIASDLELISGTSWRTMAHRLGFSPQCCTKWAGGNSEKQGRVAQNQAVGKKAIDFSRTLICP